MICGGKGVKGIRGKLRLVTVLREGLMTPVRSTQRQARQRAAVFKLKILQI